MRLDGNTRHFNFADYGGKESAMVAAVEFEKLVRGLLLKFDMKRGKARLLRRWCLHDSKIVIMFYVCIYPFLGGEAFYVFPFLLPQERTQWLEEINIVSGSRARVADVRSNLLEACFGGKLGRVLNCFSTWNSLSMSQSACIGVQT